MHEQKISLIFLITFNIDILYEIIYFQSENMDLVITKFMLDIYKYIQPTNDIKQIAVQYQYKSVAQFCQT